MIHKNMKELILLFILYIPMCMYTWGIRKFKQYKMEDEKNKKTCILFEIFTRLFCVVLLVFICVIKDGVIRANENYDPLFIILVLLPFALFVFLQKPLGWSMLKNQ